MSRGVQIGILRAVRWMTRPWIGATLVALVMWAGCVATARRIGIPAPYVHDEWSYLLAADTFARGRLTNPPHPLSEHFESFQILQRPTYSSKYPPAQGAVLAAGKVLGGEAIYGNWALAGLMAAAVFWALRAWTHGRWAMLGALLVVAKTGFGSYWAQSYWGGYVAALGGALLVGGLRRVIDRPRPLDGILVGFGVVVLANSRPWEGLVLAVGGAVFLAVALLRRTAVARHAVLLRALLPMAAVLLAGVAWTAIHNRAVTGSPWRFPYMVHTEQYVTIPFFLWEGPRPPRTYAHKDLEVLHKQVEPIFVARLEDYPREGALRLRSIVDNFVGRAIAWVGLGVLLTLRRRSVVTALLWMAWVLLGHFAAAPYLTHYSAPSVVLIALLFGLGVRGWSVVRVRGRKVRWVVVACALVAMIWAALASVPRAAEWARVHQLGLGGHKPALTRRLTEAGGRHLVIVRYGENHNPHYEWVFNEADIDGARIVWARDMGEARNREILDYYPERTAWRLTVDWEESEPALEPISR